MIIYECIQGAATFCKGRQLSFICTLRRKFMNTVLILLSEPFADWEAAYICPELNKLEDYEIKTVSLSKAPVTTMGGLKVLPDYDIDNIPENINIKLLLIPGGLSWDNTEYKKYCKNKKPTIEIIYHSRNINIFNYSHSYISFKFYNFIF